MMKSTDQSISNLGAATSTIVGDKPNYPKEVQTLLDQWNIQNFNVDIYSKIPVEITNTIKLLAQDPTKWAFANKIVDIVQPLISEFNLATIQKLFVPCDQNGANCQLFTI